MIKHRPTFISATLGVAGSLLVLGAAAPQTSRAQTYTEVGDAGSTLAGAQATGASAGQTLTTIFGTIGSGTDADVFQLSITNTSLFSASTVNAGTPTLDTALFLFDLAGHPIFTNDDASGTSFQSTLPAGNSLLTTLSAGTYYLAISLSGNEAVNAVNQRLFAPYTGGDPTSVRGPATGLNPDTLGDFDGQTNSPETGGYRIDLNATATAVPEPSTWALLAGAGALVLGTTLSRRRRAMRVTVR